MENQFKMSKNCEICSTSVEANQLFKHISVNHPVQEIIDLNGIKNYYQSNMLVASKSEKCILRNCANRVDEKKKELFVPRLRIRLSSTTDFRMLKSVSKKEIGLGVFMCSSHFMESSNIIEESFLQFGMAQMFHPKLDLANPKPTHKKNRPLYQLKIEKISKHQSETLSVIVKENVEGENGKGKDGERRKKRLSKYLKKMKFENVLLKDQVKEKFVENANLIAE